MPPHTKVEPLTFDDVPFEVEQTPGATCFRCTSSSSFLVEILAQFRAGCVATPTGASDTKEA